MDVDQQFAERFGEAPVAEKGRKLEPLPLIGTVAEAADFPVAALGPFMRGAVEAIAAIALVPPSLAANSVLSACSLAIQGHADVLLPTGAYRPTSLFMVSIAESGDRKSTSDDLAMRAVAKYQKQLAEDHARETADFAAARDAWVESRKVVTAANKSLGRDVLAEAYKDLGPKPEEPMQPYLVHRGGSTQGLIRQMELGRPSIGLMSDEGGSWLGGYGMTAESQLYTLATLSDCWDARPIQRLTAGEGCSIIYGRRLTFHLMVQPAIASQLFGNEQARGQGFLSRILPAHPPTMAGTRFVDPDQPPDPEHEKRLGGFEFRLAQILQVALPFDAEANALKPRNLTLSAEAKRLWWDFYNACERRVGPGGDLEDVRGFVGKVAEQAARLAAVIAVFEHGLSAREIPPDIMASGIALATFYLSEAARLIGVTAVDQSIVEAQYLTTWLTNAWTENLISIRAVSQKGPNRLRKLGADRLRLVLEALERHNHLVKQGNGGQVCGSHAAEAWRVVRP